MKQAKESRQQRAMRIAESNNGATMRTRTIKDKKKQAKKYACRKNG